MNLSTTFPLLFQFPSPTEKDWTRQRTSLDHKEQFPQVYLKDLYSAPFSFQYTPPWPHLIIHRYADDTQVYVLDSL